MSHRRFQNPSLYIIHAYRIQQNKSIFFGTVFIVALAAIVRAQCTLLLVAAVQLLMKHCAKIIVCIPSVFHLLMIIRTVFGCRVPCAVWRVCDSCNIKIKSEMLLMKRVCCARKVQHVNCVYDLSSLVASFFVHPLFKFSLSFCWLRMHMHQQTVDRVHK